MWTVVLTAVIAWLTFLTLRTYKKIEFLTGAMESHSTLQIRLEILKWNADHPDKEIKLLWWDKTRADTPSQVVPAHGQPVMMNEVYFMLPLNKREGQDSLSRDIRVSIQSLCQYVTGKSRWPRD